MPVPPSGYGQCSMIHVDSGTAEGTPPYIWGVGMVLDLETDPAVVANIMFQAWVDHWAPLTDSNISLSEVQVAVNDGAGGTVIATSTMPITPGGPNLDLNYQAIAPKIKKVTADLGRKNRGVYHPVGVLDISDVDSDGILNSTRLTDIQAANDDFFADTVTSIGQPCIIHSDSLILPTIITGFVVQQKVGILRNRTI